MSNTFKPRAAGNTAWKTWHKDAFRLMGRVGVVWLALWTVVGVGIAWQAAMLTKHSAGYLLVLLSAQMVGVLAYPVIQAALDQAARAERVSLLSAFRQAVMEMVAQKEWFLRRVAGQVVTFLLMILVMVVVPLLLRNVGSEDAPAPPTDPLNPVVTIVAFFTAVPIFLRKHGTLDFRYWLTVRHNIPASITPLLQNLAQLLNPKSFLLGSFSLMGLYLLLSFSMWAVVMLVFLPLLQWYHCAFIRCAYHDVFEDGTGLTEKAAVTATEGFAAPVLQA